LADDGRRLALVADCPADPTPAPVEGVGVPLLLTRPVNNVEAGPYPRRRDFDSLSAYELAFLIWRAIHRDGQLTNAELSAKLDVLEDEVHRRLWAE
jgi:hypothetical protein